MRVLVVEDDPALGRALCETLQAAGMLTEHCADGQQAAFLGATEGYDAAVLDLGLPGLDGVGVLRHWREQQAAFPVLVLTARGRWSDKLQAFEAGADDYLTKPFLHDEVVLRLRVLRRRAWGRPDALLRAGALALDTTSQRFTLDGRTLALTAQEHRILAHLMHRQGAVVSRAELAEHVYARDTDPDSNTLDVLVGRIRRKLGRPLVHTERGRGWRLAAEDDGAEA
ncbi:DNA-binding response regulator [Rubrivivax gelatinosus]|uniref:response regulator n=1 Tax=Rubrivivax gelatinosus TaxID=28068 RepID=UPI00190728E7|nr:DNA-binding response regulator [Rubrivivax gelatinosus]